jgi:hypothetical protein
MNERTRICVVYAVLLSAATVFGTPADFSPLTLFYRPVDYIAPVYSSPQREPYLFFSSEPVHFEVFIFNGSDAVSDLTATQPSIRDAFAFTVRLDDRPVHPRITLESEVYSEQIGPRQPLVWAPRLTISPHQKIVFHWRMAESDVMPGRYRIEVVPKMTDDAGRQIKPQASIIQFEVRDPSTPQGAADVILRRGWLAFLAGQYNEAEKIANELLSTNTRSYAALVLKGKLASVRQKPVEQLEMYRAALALAEGNLDPWCTRCAADLSIPSVIEGLRCLVRGVLCE